MHEMLNLPERVTPSTNTSSLWTSSFASQTKKYFVCLHAYTKDEVDEATCRLAQKEVFVDELVMNPIDEPMTGARVISVQMTLSAPDCMTIDAVEDSVSECFRVFQLDEIDD